MKSGYQEFHFQFLAIDWHWSVKLIILTGGNLKSLI